MDITKSMARSAVFSLKEAVLDVLFQARSGEYLQPQEISRCLGIPRSSSAAHPYGLIRGTLYLLLDEKRVEHITNVGWRISESEVELLSGLLDQ